MSEPTVPRAPQQERLIDRLQQLNESANRGDEAAQADLRFLLDEHPQIWKELGDLASHSERMLIQRIAGTNAALAESLHRKCDELRAEMVGGRPTVLQRAAADQVVNCWLGRYLLDARYGSLSDNLTTARKVDQLRNSAQRRFDSALRSLQLVKQKLGVHKQPSEKPGQKLKIYKFPA